MPQKSDPVMLSTDQLRAIVREEFDHALTRMGFDTSEPVESQKDLQFVREWRTSAEGIKKKTLMTIVTLVVTGAAGLLWAGFKAAAAIIPTAPHP